MTNANFPETLVLPMTSLFEDNSKGHKIVQQIAQGNTFSLAFDMTKAPCEPQQNGLVHLLPGDQSNSKVASSVQMSNEGLSNAIGFMSIENTPAVIFGEKVTITRVFLVGTPKGAVFNWQAGVIIDDEISLVYEEQGVESNKHLSNFMATAAA